MTECQIAKLNHHNSIYAKKTGLSKIFFIFYKLGSDICRRHTEGDMICSSLLKNFLKSVHKDGDQTQDHDSN